MPPIYDIQDAADSRTYPYTKIIAISLRYALIPLILVQLSGLSSLFLKLVLSRPLFDTRKTELS